MDKLTPCDVPPHDVQTWSNLADALVQEGEALVAVGEPGAAQASFTAAIQAYESSCSLTDSEAGDSLPDLLCNWGMGLLTISKHTQVSRRVGRCRNKQQAYTGEKA